MNIKKRKSYIPAIRQKLFVCLAIILLITASFDESHCYPLSFRDSSGRDITVEKEPVSVVSLVPSITEIICRIGAGDRLKAVTLHCTWPSETANKRIVGGFLNPDLDLVDELKPDIIFYNDIQKGVAERFGKDNVVLVDLETISIAESFRHIRLLGDIFNREKEAEVIIEENRRYIDLIQKKIAQIPEEKRKRVMRLMGRDSIMTPGDDSFQNEIIALAGGISPRLNKKGQIAEMSKTEFIEFNPQFIYGCGNDSRAAEKFFNLSGFREVDAVKNREVQYFPCDLTCRASTNTGYFISWLSAEIYRDEFSKRENLILDEEVTGSRKLDVSLDYVKEIRIDYSNMYDYSNKTLIVDFKSPLSVVSTLEGSRDGVMSIGNHYAPLSCWSIAHEEDLETTRARICDILGKSQKDTCMLFTGADVDNLAIAEKSYRDMKVVAIVTAGVKSNAMRMSKDDGSYYEPGTINIIILPNMKLTERAATRAIITATEAKTAVLQDLDIRSSYRPEYQATGTGTDNIIIAVGAGDLPIDNTGGHSKMGELIAGAVYDGVRKAIFKQNGILAERNVFQRLADRKIGINEDVIFDDCECGITKEILTERLEKILLDPVYASFITTSLAISDEYESGLITDLTQFEMWCYNVIYDISGKKVTDMKEFIGNEKTPVLIRMALNALLNGIYQMELKE